VRLNDFVMVDSSSDFINFTFPGFFIFLPVSFPI